jgi:hypothetical protein
VFLRCSNNLERFPNPSAMRQTHDGSEINAKQQWKLAQRTVTRGNFRLRNGQTTFPMSLFRTKRFAFAALCAPQHHYICINNELPHSFKRRHPV